jgi:hypothetical protein
MGVGVALVAAAIIGGATAAYSADQQRKAANQQADAAKEAAAQAAADAEELAKIQATRDKTTADISKDVGRLDLGEAEAERKRRARGKAALIIERKDNQTADPNSRVQIGATTPSAKSGGVQL